jgi:hypothetical protein
MVTSTIAKSNGAKAAEADVNVTGSLSMTELLPEVEEKAAHFIDNYLDFLKERTEAYMNRMAGRRSNGPVAEFGEVTTFLGYQYWNVLTVGPIQFLGDPPWRPNKVIAAGEIAMLLGVVWVNPAADPGGGVPGTVVLGGRGYRIAFETINLSNVTNGPSAVFSGVFPPVPGIHLFPWFFIPGDPGTNPHLYQAHLTADITNVAQPFAAFATWHLDLDREPGFLGLPAQDARWEYDVPCQYLVYRK